MLELTKEKQTLTNKQINLKNSEHQMQLKANKLATEYETNKEQTRQNIEQLRKELDTQQKKAKTSTIEYTEARNELLELLQAYNKCSKDFDELKSEKEQRSNILTQLKNTLFNEHENLKKQIGELSNGIFMSEEYLE